MDFTTNGLFRDQAVDQHINRLHGEILLLPHLSHICVLAFLLFWVASASYWLSNSAYARKVTVAGWLEPSTGVIHVYAEGSGVIKQVLVDDGDSVAEAQPLIIINGNRILANGAHLESVLLVEYETQRKLLNQQLERSQSIYLQRKQDIAQRIVAAQEQLSLLGRQKLTLEKRFSLISNKVIRYQKLRKNQHISSSDLDVALGEELELRSRREALSRNQLSQYNQIQQLHTESQLLPDEHANTMGQLSERLSNIAQQISKLNSQRAQLIKAPRAGVVSNLQVSEGQQSQSGIPLLSLVPKGAHLTAQLLVPVRSVGFIEVSQSLDIRYDAFSYQKFGLYQGTVVSISDAVLLPNELLAAPVTIQEPVYRVSAKLEQSSIQAYGRELSLRSGMTFSADVRLEDRTLIQWLLEPIYSLKGRL